MLEESNDKTNTEFTEVTQAMDFFSKMLTKQNAPRVGALAVMFAAMLWGIDGAVLTPQLYTLDVVNVVFLLHALAFLFMIPLLWVEIKELKKLNSKDWLAFCWIALFGGAVGTMAITQALFLVHFVPLSVPILIQKLQPLFAIFLALIILKEKPSKEFYAYGALALAGSYLITFGFESPVISLENKTLVAAGLGLVAAFAFGSCTTVGRYAVEKINYRVSTYLRFGMTALLMAALVLALGKLGNFAAITQFQWLVMLVIVFTTGGVAIGIYYYGLRFVPAAKATFYELAFPATAIVLDFVLNGKILSLGQFAGAAVLLWAVYKINQTKVALGPGEEIKPLEA
jgi:drug/metabolite transporter (DMT)-like permease